MNQLLERRPEGAASGDEGPHQKKKNGPDWAELRRRGAVEWKNLKEWSRIHFRRAAHIAHGALLSSALRQQAQAATGKSMESASV